MKMNEESLNLESYSEIKAPRVSSISRNENSSQVFQSEDSSLNPYLDKLKNRKVKKNLSIKILDEASAYVS